MIITSLYAGLLAFLFLALSARVVAVRSRVSLGDGGDPVVLRRMRGHANFAEYVPLILLMMAMLETQHTAGWLLHIFGVVLVFARVIHGIALSFTQKWFFGRFVGTALTFTLLAVCGILCVVQGLRGIGVF